ncbi:MAG: hypothetical protein Fur002_04810 [Anaerolineales bacterium]
MTKIENLSSFEKLLLGIEPPNIPTVGAPLRLGDLCPQCAAAQLEYNSTLQLACPQCGFVNGEAGGCT